MSLLLATSTLGIPEVAVPFSSYTRLSRNQILSISSGSNDWHGRPTMVDRNGVWILCTRESTAHGDNGVGQCNINFSTDLGKNWTANNIFTDGGNVTGFPLVATDPSATSTADILLLLCPNGDLIAIGHERDTQSVLAAWKTVVQHRSTDGGKTWSVERDLGAYLVTAGIVSDKTKTWSFYDYMIIGTTIYLVFSEYTGSGSIDDTQVILIKSTDNGQSWTHVSNVVDFAEAPALNPCVETGIVHLDEGKILTIMRHNDNLTVGSKISTDYGVTWGSLLDVTSKFPGGVNVPRISDLDGKIYMYGRDRQSSTESKNAFFWTDDEGDIWNYVDLDQGFSYQEDGGYVTVLKRSATQFVFIGYYGPKASARIYEYVIKGNK